MIFQVYRYTRLDDDTQEYQLINEVGAEDGRAAIRLALELFPELRNDDPQRYPLGRVVVRPSGDYSGMPGFQSKSDRGDRT